MKIYIQTTTGLGETYNFEVKSSISIQQLKRLFLKKSGDDQDLQTMCFVYKELLLDDDEGTLADYNITDKCILQLADLSAINRSGFVALGQKFVDVGNSTGLKKQEWSKTASRWRITTPGLCLEGTCANDQCEAHNQRVIMPIGYKKFDILLDTDETTTICPICKKYVDPETCSFNNCWWRYEGVRQDGVRKGIPPKKCSSDWEHADNVYHYFDQDISGAVIWKKLIVEAVKNKPQK